MISLISTKRNTMVWFVAPYSGEVIQVQYCRAIGSKEQELLNLGQFDYFAIKGKQVLPLMSEFSFYKAAQAYEYALEYCVPLAEYIIDVAHSSEFNNDMQRMNEFYRCCYDRVNCKVIPHLQDLGSFKLLLN